MSPKFQEKTLPLNTHTHTHTHTHRCYPKAPEGTRRSIPWRGREEEDPRVRALIPTIVIRETQQAVHNLLLTVINKNYNREKNTHSHAWASLQCQEQYDEGEGERTRVSGE